MKNSFSYMRNKYVCLTQLWASLNIHISSQYFVAHKNYFLTYQLYAASIIFAPTLSDLELRIFRASLITTNKSKKYSYKILIAIFCF